MWVATTLAVLLAAGAIGLALFSRFGPFAENAMAETLGDALASRVVFGSFHQNFFPHPGCTAEKVSVFPKMGAAAGEAQIPRLVVEANWTGLLHHHLRRITAQDLRIRVQALGNRAFVGRAGKNIIGELVLEDATLAIGNAGDEKAPRYQFHRAVLHNVGAREKMGFNVSVLIPKPSGELVLNGDLGPFTSGQFRDTPLSGMYMLNRANLGGLDGVAGSLTSQGKFSGPLSRLAFTGQTDIPDFEVTSSHHRHHLTTQYQAIVNGTNGDTELQKLSAALDRTSFTGSGKVASAGADSRSKTVWLEIAAGHGRIQDLMLLFVTAPQSPILGAIDFRARVTLPPGPEPFKKRVELTGDFGIGGGSFTSPERQESANTLSARAEGVKDEAPERVLSHLSGHVNLRGGTATFSALSFDVPGASAKLAGTYSVVDYRINLHGTLATEAKLSQTSKGIKSVFLKLLDPIFKKKPAGAVIPVSVTGDYDHPEFRELFTK